MIFRHASNAQRTAYGVAAIAAVAVLVMVLLPASKGWHQPGPDNLGHTDIACVDCHADAPGSARQQIQANLAHLVGTRDTPAWFMRQPTGNRECLDCHENETDLHPVYRFNEPRFAEVRAALAPQYCVSCHTQHQGNRVNVGYELCRHCHQDMDLRDDPIDVPHSELVAEARWDTCFGCHDFHGNHMNDTPTRMAEMARREDVEAYFEGGRSPYGSRRLTVMQTMKVNEP